MLQADTFWQYSLRVYGQQRIKNQCLLLQNEYSLNVNMVLLCGFLNEQQFFVGAEVLKTLSLQIENIDQQLRTLRIKRIACKTQQPELYKTLLSQELILEKHQQTTLIAALNDVSANDSNSGSEFVEQSKDNFMSYYKSLETSDAQIIKDIMIAKAFIVDA